MTAGRGARWLDRLIFCAFRRRRRKRLIASAPLHAGASRCDTRKMRRWDRYDYIGAALLAFVVALFALHFILPAGPPPAPV